MVSPEFFVPARIPVASAPQLFVVVDTEEAFDWLAPFSRDSVDVSAIAEVGRLQDVLAPYGLTPTYVIDYPVASTPSSAERLSTLAHRGECHIGAHLHPWVNPPYLEPMGTHSSYACNLGAELEREKIGRLKDIIVERLGVTPRAYKAGRYGFGATTAAVIESLGFDIDLSINPHMDFSSDGGPSFEGFDPVPAYFGVGRTLLELPCTTGFIGAARRVGPALHRVASSRWLSPVRAVGVLARSGTLNKVMLSPEGNTYEEMKALTRTLFHEGVRTFSLTLHSPSLVPGCTCYVRTAEERDQFLRTIDRYCHYFITEFGGLPSTPADLFDQLARTHSSNQGHP